MPLIAATCFTSPPSHGTPPPIQPDSTLTAHTADFLTLLYPLHEALLPVLYNLTTTSLLTAELQLLAIAMINILLYAESPQMIILQTLLWGGGLSIILCCGSVLNWVVTLARIPSWRFRPARKLTRSSTGLLKASKATVNGITVPFGRSLAQEVGSDADDDDPPHTTANGDHSGGKLIGLGVNIDAAENVSSPRVLSPGKAGKPFNYCPPIPQSPRRRHTFSVPPLPTAFRQTLQTPVGARNAGLIPSSNLTSP